MQDRAEADVPEVYLDDMSGPPAPQHSPPHVLERRIPRGFQPREGVWHHHAFLALFTVLWGSNFVLAEVALLEMSPISFSVARFLMGGIGMVLLFYGNGWTGRNNGRSLRLPAIRRGEWPRLLVVSLFGATLAPWLGIEGLGLTHAGRAAFWLALAPVVSAVFGVLLGTERVGRMGRIGVLIAGLGTAGLAIESIGANQQYQLGDALLILALVLAVAELHLIKPLAARHGAIPIVTLRTIIGWAFYMLIATPSVLQQDWLNLTFWTWAAIILGGTVGVGMGQWVKVRALRAIGPTQIVVYGNLVPLATIAVGWATIGSGSSPIELAAGILIVTGALCLQAGGSAAQEHQPPVA